MSKDTTPTSTIISPPGVISTTNGTTTTETISNRQVLIIGTVSGTIAVLLLLGTIYFWRRRKRKLEDDRNMNIDQSTWMDSPHTSFWAFQSPFHSRHDNSATSSIPSITPLRPVRRTLPRISPPSTSNYASSSSNEFYLPSTPEYKSF